METKSDEQVHFVAAKSGEDDGQTIVLGSEADVSLVDFDEQDMIVIIQSDDFDQSNGPIEVDLSQLQQMVASSQISNVTTAPITTTSTNHEQEGQDEYIGHIDPLFANPGYSLVANRILELLSYSSIKSCREVSPVWKTFIDQQKFWRLDHFFSLIKKDWMVQKTSSDMSCTAVEKVDILEKFPEWKNIIPYVENEMSVLDIDKLIKGLEFSFEKNHAMFPKITDWEEATLFTSQLCHQFCPLHFAVQEDDFEFVDLMLRTPFEMDSLKFKLETCEEGSTRSRRHRNCDTGDEPYRRWDSVTHWDDDFNVLEKVANCGSAEIVNLILENAEDKKINKGKKAIYAARNRPEIVKLLMKHCDFDMETLCHLGTRNLAHLAILQAEDDKSSGKNIETTGNHLEWFGFTSVTKSNKFYNYSSDPDEDGSDGYDGFDGSDRFDGSYGFDGSDRSDGSDEYNGFDY